MGIFPDGVTPPIPGTSEAEEYLWTMEVSFVFGIIEDTVS